MSRQGSEVIMLFREDMDRAFRQLSADFLHVPLLGFWWRGRYYFDLVMMMGCRIAPYICQRTTSMVAYIHRQSGFNMVNYIDDFLRIEFASKIYQLHKEFIQLLNDIGVGRLEQKVHSSNHTK